MTTEEEPMAKRPPVVDPSPTAPPIDLNPSTLDEELAKHPGTVSDAETLALKPNSLKNNPPEGPHPQVDSLGYTTWTKPDGTSFIAPVSNDETYARKGFTKGSTEQIADLGAYQAERAATPAA